MTWIFGENWTVSNEQLLEKAATSIGSRFLASIKSICFRPQALKATRSITLMLGASIAVVRDLQGGERRLPNGFKMVGMGEVGMC
jgi:hypothetical protein